MLANCAFIDIFSNFSKYEIASDGNCIFRAISYALFDTQDKHAMIRKKIVENVVANWEYYGQFISSNNSNCTSSHKKSEYEVTMRRNGIYGGHVEFMSASNIFNLSIIIHRINEQVIRIGTPSNNKKELHVLYDGIRDEGHYDVLLQNRKRRRNEHIGNGEEGTDGKCKKKKNMPEKRDRVFLGKTSEDVCPLKLDLCIRHCGALSFQIERGRSKNACCHQGKVQLDTLPELPDYLKSLFCDNEEEMLHFRMNIRHYNNSFAMAAFCPTQDATLPGVGSIKIRGEVNVRGTTSLISAQPQNPSFAQIYIYDNEVALAYRSSDHCRPSVLSKIQEIMENNPYVKMYKKVIDYYEGSNYDSEVNLCFLRLQRGDHHRYIQPNNDVREIAAIITTGGEGNIPSNIDFIAYPKHQYPSKIIPKFSAHNEPMVFPLFFPFGTPGYSSTLFNSGNHRNARKITVAQYFGQRLAIHLNKFNPFLCGGRLTQQYIIYGYIIVEWDRLNYLRCNQQLFRRETFQGLSDHIQNSNSNTSDKVRLGNAVVLPSSYDGSPRAMQQLYQDSMALSSELGRPDLFITFTANPQWPEIKEYLKLMPAGITASDIPYFVVRAFNSRLLHFLDEICSGKVFGEVLGHVYTIEHQGRGLPHSHCIFILSSRDKFLTPEKLDQFISAEIPEKSENPELFKKVMKHMLHGPHKDSTPCWNTSTGECSKKFPKAFISATDMTGDSFPRYKRRDNRQALHVYNARVNGKSIPVDNSMVVPFNPYLLLKYDCHINVEYCGSIMAIKYIHKYITKGHDRIKLNISNSNEETPVDEIQNYIDSRYLSSMEAAWRLMKMPIHGHSHAVIRLPVHLPGQQYITFTEGNESEAIIENRADTKLTAYFKLNEHDAVAKNMYYCDIPKQYVWKEKNKTWTKRIRDNRVIARLYSVSPKDSERFFLKILLKNVKGAAGFGELKSFNGVDFETFKEAAYARGFVSEDTGVEDIMLEATSTMMPKSLRAFFAYLILTCDKLNVNELLEKFGYFLYEGTTKNQAIIDIECRLNSEDRSLKEFGIDVAIDSLNFFDDDVPNEEHFAIYLKMYDQLNELQKKIADLFSEVLVNPLSNQKLLFVHGFGGAGKTFLYTSIYHNLKAHNKKIVSVAWTGIAAILLPMGKTAHRIFKLPLQLTPDIPLSPVHLSKKAKQILTEVEFIFWDEASMIPSIVLSIVDLTLRDLMKSDEPFGGKFLLLGGDFRQVLPIVKNGSRQQIVQATIMSSPLWPLFQCFNLTQNMRAENEHFNTWLLKIGNGDVENLEIPSNVLCDDLIKSVYNEDFSLENLKTSVLLACRNCEVDKLNEQLLEKIPGELITSEGHSWATAVDGDDTDSDELNLMYQPEYLQSLNPAGLPPQRLNLKIGSIVMLLRNICVKDGLCNGTRLIVCKVEKNSLYCTVLTGSNEGNVVVLPKIVLNTRGSTNLPFVLHRRQFPVRLAFSMTINKSQGQTFNKVGLYIDQTRPIFGHGQLYVALSRCRSFNGLKIQIVEAKNEEEEKNIQNVVFKEVLNYYNSEMTEKIFPKSIL